MTFKDIDIYFSGFNIDLKTESTSFNSKWVYAKELLANVEDRIIYKIAEQLGLEYSREDERRGENLETDFWRKGYFKLFLSHISEHKKKMTLLQQSLFKYGISSFVAHEDIIPTKEWQLEIEKALFTMDALAAMLTPKFNESSWTDQEVGVAVGRDVLVIPIRRGIDPYGFIGKYQGFQSNGKTVGEVAEGIYNIIINNNKTKGKMLEALTEQLLFSRKDEMAKKKISLLEEIDQIPNKYLEKIQENAYNNEIIRKSEKLINKLNQIMKKHNLNEIYIDDKEETDISFEVPF